MQGGDVRFGWDEEKEVDAMDWVGFFLLGVWLWMWGGGCGSRWVFGVWEGRGGKGMGWGDINKWDRMSGVRG